MILSGVMGLLILGLYVPRYKCRTERIALGTTRTGRTIFEIHRKYGVTPITARTRAGKTCIVKIILVHMANKGRRIICFDPENDYQELNRMNNKADRPRAVPNLKIIKRFAIPISEFKQEDWHTLDFPELSTKIIADLALKEDQHNNDPEKFKLMLEELPTNEREAMNFYRAYGIQAKQIPAVSKSAIMLRFELCARIFHDPRETSAKEKLDKKRIQELALEHNLVFDTYLFENCEYKTVVGIILRSLFPILRRIKPIIVLEECDKLCGTKDETSSSYRAIRQLALKRQRDDVHLLAVAQAPLLINDAIMGNYHRRIAGKLVKEQDDEVSERIRINPEADERQFCVVDDNNWAYYFEPIICPCL